MLRRQSGFIQMLVFVPIAGLLVACGGGGGSSGGGGGTTVQAEGTEAAVNTTPISYGGTTTTITSLAQFERFDDYNPGTDVTSSCGTSGNPCKQGLVHLSTFNIRFAEVQIYNASTGALVQAGETHTDGVISMVMPKVAGNYRLEVHSRAYNTSQYEASVLNNPYDKAYYTISANFTLTGSEGASVAVSLPVASHTGTLEGGAFNILNDILIANDWLRAHAPGQNSSSSSPDYCLSSVCNTFTVAPKVQIYWTKGLSPGTYYGDPSTGISFFAPTSGGGIYSGLYILGGISGSICTDTDHFDNSVIIHEYGHFLEKSFGHSDSPGGSHDGDNIIDPRLAWSEGWADFFQSAVLGRAFYRDTTSNADCPASNGGFGNYSTAKLSFSDFSMKNQSSGQDTPTRAGEGNFREMSIARSLRDTLVGADQTSPNNDTSGFAYADLGFAIIWDAFQGLSSASLHFRNSGLINSLIHDGMVTLGMSFPNAREDDTGANTHAVLVYEKQRHDQKNYGHLLTRMPSLATGTCTGSPNSSWFPFIVTNLGPVKDTTDTGTNAGSISYSDPMNTNDFYQYYYDGTAAHSRVNFHYKISSSDTSGVGTPWDLDLYVYGDGYTFLNSSDIVASSEGYYPETGGNGSYPGFETLDFSGLAAGTYIINVKVDYGPQSSRKADTQYYFEGGNGDQLCP